MALLRRPYLLALTMTVGLTTAPAIVSGRPLTAQRVNDEDLQHRIDRGDPSVIPALMQTLGAAIASPDREDRQSDTMLALRGVAAFRLEEAGPTLVAIYRNSHEASRVRDACATAAAAIGDENARHFLQTLRDDPTIKGRPRMEVLAALSSLGDNSARQALFEIFTKPFRDATDPDDDLNVAGYVIGQLDDPWFIQPILQWRDRQTDSDARDCAEMVADSVRINALPKDEVFKIAEDADYAHGTARRYSAIDALSRKASLDDIPRIDSLPEWKNLPAVRADERVRLDFGKKQTVMRLRQLHWRDQPATEPSRH